jgi:hypothetical protein
LIGYLNLWADLSQLSEGLLLLCFQIFFFAEKEKGWPGARRGPRGDWAGSWSLRWLSASHHHLGIPRSIDPMC